MRSSLNSLRQTQNHKYNEQIRKNVEPGIPQLPGISMKERTESIVLYSMRTGKRVP